MYLPYLILRLKHTCSYSTLKFFFLDEYLPYTYRLTHTVGYYMKMSQFKRQVFSKKSVIKAHIDSKREWKDVMNRQSLIRILRDDIALTEKIIQTLNKQSSISSQK